MAFIIIDPSDQAAPNWGLPKGFYWEITEKKVPYKSAEGIVIPGLSTVMVFVYGAKQLRDAGYSASAHFKWIPHLEKKGQYRDRMMYAAQGIAHDISVMLEGGDGKGSTNLLLDKMAQKIADETGMDPAVVNRDLQHQNIGEA